MPTPTYSRFSYDVTAAMLLYWKKSFGNLILLLCKIWATFCHCFVHQYGRLITWMKTKNSRGLYLYSFLQFIDNQKTFTGAPYIITDPLDLYPRHLTSVDECRVDSFFIFSFPEESHYLQLMITPLKSTFQNPILFAFKTLSVFHHNIHWTQKKN